MVAQLKKEMPLSGEEHEVTSFHVLDAVVAWRDKIHNSKYLHITKCQYLSNMLKLIESKIINTYTRLDNVDKDWLIMARKNVDDIHKWSPKTKKLRRTCLNSFYSFVKKEFDYGADAYKRQLKDVEIQHLLSSTKEKYQSINVDPLDLCNIVHRINNRDGYILWLMFWTGQKLERILELKKTEKEKQYIHFFTYSNDIDNGNNECIPTHEESEWIPQHIEKGIDEVTKDSKFYLFETNGSKRVRAMQVRKNLQRAAKLLGVDFHFSPKAIQGYVCGHTSRNKKSELEQWLLG